MKHYKAPMGQIRYQCPHGGGVAVFHRHVVGGEWDLEAFFCLRWDCRVARGRIEQEARRPLAREWRKGLRKLARGKRKQRKLVPGRGKR